MYSNGWSTIYFQASSGLDLGIDEQQRNALDPLAISSAFLVIKAGLVEVVNKEH